MNLATSKTAGLNFVRRHLFQYPRVESLLAKLVAGRSPTHWLCRLVPNHDQYKTGTLRSIKRENLQLEVDLSDLMEWSLYYDFLDSSAQNLARLCEVNDVVIDVGANIGASILNVIKRVGASGRIYAFEPDPGRFEKCWKNVELSGLHNVEIFPIGLGDTPGAAEMRVRSPHNQGMNQILPTGAIAPSTVAVELSTLDSFCETNQIRSVNVIKIDVEGFETKVLKGASDTLRNLKPILFVEVDDANLRTHGSSPVELIEFLEGLGYQVFANRIGETLPPLEYCHFDLIALPPDKEGEHD